MPPGPIDDLIQSERLPDAYRATVDTYYAPLSHDVAALRQRMGRGLVLGICGAQGSGKSTAALFLKALLEDQGLRVAIISLDDVYLTHDARQHLAATVHPLLQTRGVPGTHDVDLGVDTMTRLIHAGAGDRTPLPRFDKAQDTQMPRNQWPVFEGPADVVIFEGWCVGARPQSDEALATPINALERDEDADGRWRGYVNGKLAQDYGSLFGLIDMLVFLRAPSFECVYDWRKKQERKLADKVRHTGGATRIMNDAELKRFIMHYERLTRHILSTMPGYADVVFELNERQQIIKRV